tara:strand:- start:1498 stop:1701 length:204 start_codon:yes stop_codon:yes gene_type:complete
VSSVSTTPSRGSKHNQNQQQQQQMKPQPLSSPSLEQLFLQTQSSMKRLRSHANKARGKLKPKADQGK